MTYTGRETILRKAYSCHTPAGLYEANYRRLNRLIPKLKSLKLNKNINLPISKLSIKVLEQYKYTSVLKLNQPLAYSFESSLSTMGEDLAMINMELRVCYDACLIEVIAYQGKNPIHSPLNYPNKHMLQVDEKKQLNLLLKDILDSALKCIASRHRETVIS